MGEPDGVAEGLDVAERDGVADRLGCGECDGLGAGVTLVVGVGRSVLGVVVAGWVAAAGAGTGRTRR